MTQIPQTEKQNETWTLDKFIEQNKDRISEEKLTLLKSFANLSGFEFTSSVYVPKDINKPHGASLTFYRKDKITINISLEL
jgi:hypothetical protein